VSHTTSAATKPFIANTSASLWYRRTSSAAPMTATEIVAESDQVPLARHAEEPAMFDRRRMPGHAAGLR